MSGIFKKLYNNDVKMTIYKDKKLPGIIVICFEKVVGNKKYCGKYFHDISTSDIKCICIPEEIKLYLAEFLHDLEGKSDVC